MLMFVHGAVLASVGQARSLWWVSCYIRWWRTEVGHCGHSACLSIHNVCCQHWLLTSTVHLTDVQSMFSTWQSFSLCSQFSYCTLDRRSVYVDSCCIEHFQHLTGVQSVLTVVVLYTWQAFRLCWQLVYCTLDRRSVYVQHLTGVQFMLAVVVLYTWQAFSLCSTLDRCSVYVDSCCELSDAAALWWLDVHLCVFNVITFHVMHSQDKMYGGHGRMCVCLSPQSHTTAQNRM